jgi:hypothetical protein
MKSTMRAGAGVALGLMLALAAMGAWAEPNHGHGEGRAESRGEGHWQGRGDHYDARYSHNHYYYNRGMVVRALPGTPYVVARGGGHYYYSGGVWYVPRGPGFVVIGAPIGAFVQLLPTFYTTVWVAGFPYYYANETYYAWRGEDNGYEVVEPPSDQGPPTTQPPPSDELFIYPQSGQSEQQQSNDKYECHRWASSQTGFDPTQSAGGVSPDQMAAKRADYQRAMRACLEGRGYSVR